jgi:short-subunit dehydrogenase
MRAWVTGAGSGIGRALSKRLASEGWDVAVSARSEDQLRSLADEVPGRISVYPLDVTDEAAVLAAVEAIGDIDLAVLNAGTYKRVSAPRFSAEDFRTIVEVNLIGTGNCLGAIIPRMAARKSGHIAVVSSLTGYVGLPSAAAYGATKAALINMCEALYPELERVGVMMTVINPGFVKTPLTDKNDFSMPFLIEVEDAVDRIMTGLKAKKFEIAFPRRMNFAIRLGAALPRFLKFAITRGFVRNQ